MVLLLDSFSTELLLKIFKYLDIRDLCRLKQTCKRFNDIIEKWGHSFNQNVKPLVTNQIHPDIVNRSARLLSPIERLRISRNWRLGIYVENMLLWTKVKYIPWLQLEKELLWISKGAQIQAYKRNNKGVNARNAVYNIKRNNSAEISCFVKKNNCILSGQVDGSLILWSKENSTFTSDMIQCHDADVNTVEMCDNIIVSGSKDNYVKIRHKDNLNETLYEINVQDRVWSVALQEANKSLLAIGSAGISNISTIKVFDMNNQTTFDHFIYTLNGRVMNYGVLDMKWESSSIFWTCGYSGCLMRWDLRTGKCEQILNDPNYETIYCFQCDHFNTIIGGTQSHGRVVLWDTRQTNYVQMYFMNSCRRPGRSSPIYSLSYDADFLFAATDHYLNVLDFSTFKGSCKDYGNLFVKSIKA